MSPPFAKLVLDDEALAVTLALLLLRIGGLLLVSCWVGPMVGRPGRCQLPW
ncbi:hypothetical protein [Streptomyces carpinensis]|uniref:Uncharacterized protein n=1 Tax=Streptomyces carpinensis TaxID=66369 RepID=A0ABV1W3Q1_9ACTN|nr:hypothetical protein [Streptomyces carpinensis]